MGRKLEGLPALRCAVVALAVAAAALVAAPIVVAQEPAPAVTVPVDAGGGSAPAPAPDPAPTPDTSPQSDDSGGGSSSGSAPAPSAEPPPAEAPASDEGEQGDARPSAEEKAKERKRKQQEQKRREQEQQEAEQAQAAAEQTTAIAPATTERNEGPFAGGAITTSTPVSDTGEVAPTTIDEPEPSGETTLTAIAQPVAFPAEQESSTLPGVAPVLFGLLAFSIVLLGLAAVPPWRIRAGALAGLVSGRRLELGLVGAAVLVCAVVGLLVTLLAK